MEPIGGNTRDLSGGKTATAYADDITLIVSDEGQLPYTDYAIRRYEIVVGARINQDQSVGLQHGTKKSKSMPFDNVVGHWAEGPVEML